MELAAQLTEQWAEYHERRSRWVGHNFPQQDAKGPVEATLGLVEEIGELAHAHLKEKQNIRGGVDEHIAAAKDAIGDATVYLWGITSQAPEVVDREFWSQVRQYEELVMSTDLRVLYLANAAGAVAWSVATGTAIPFQKKQLARVVGHLRGYCRSREWHYDHIVAETWASVEERDWIKYPGTGRPTHVSDH